jgi:hypothetical protein
LAGDNDVVVVGDIVWEHLLFHTVAAGSNSMGEEALEAHLLRTAAASDEHDGDVRSRLVAEEGSRTS